MALMIAQIVVVVLLFLILWRIYIMSVASDRSTASLDRLTASVDRITTAFSAKPADGGATPDNDPDFTNLADRADALSDKIDALVPPEPAG